MKRFLFASIIALIAVLSISATVGAQNYTGLWVGNATLKKVSEVNKSYTDMAFDLGLMGLKAQEEMIPKGASWNYHASDKIPIDYTDPSSNDSYSWETLEYDETVDSDWVISTGNAPYGFPQSDVTTEVTQDYSVTTIYFRKEFLFNLDDIKKYSDLKIRLWRDDGVVLYLNGQEILKNNIETDANGQITAVNEISNYIFIEFFRPTNLLKDGKNVLAAEVHQAVGPTESDLLFDLELTAMLKEPEITELMPREESDWHYHDSKYGPGAATEKDVIDANWINTSYDDSFNNDWEVGNVPFGYGGESNWTSIDPSPTVYFRKQFSVSDKSTFTHLRFLLLRDDGAVVYLNGEEILRSNMPPEPDSIDHDTAPVTPVGAANEGHYQVVDVDLGDFFDNGGQLPNGNNMVAVEVHQHPAELSGSGAPQLTRTPATFDLRLMFHVDGGGTVKLLKEVIQMYDAGTKKYVLLTNHEKVSDYDGVAVRDGEPVGRRLSAVGFGFQGTYIDCGTGLSYTGNVTCTFDLPSAHPTNPFLHRYHPDHDNLDERYEDTVAEAYEISRNIQLDFNSRYPPDVDLDERQVKPAGWGESLLGGTYTETIKGLHKNADGIVVSGPFTLRRVVTTNNLIE